MQRACTNTVSHTWQQSARKNWGFQWANTHQERTVSKAFRPRGILWSVSLIIHHCSSLLTSTSHSLNTVERDTDTSFQGGLGICTESSVWRVQTASYENAAQSKHLVSLCILGRLLCCLLVFGPVSIAGSVWNAWQVGEDKAGPSHSPFQPLPRLCQPLPLHIPI